MTLKATTAPLAIAVGDPAGVGPLVAARAAAHLWRSGIKRRLAIFGDADALRSLVAAIDPELAHRAAVVDTWAELGSGDGPLLSFVHVEGWPVAVREHHAATAEGGRAQLRILEAAAAATRDGWAAALVTGPMSKAAVDLGGTSFTGQTEHLAVGAGLMPDDVTMMFIGPRLRVALVTTHLAIRSAADAITARRVQRSVRHLAEALRRLRGDRLGSIELAVAGLNPHAGESGLLGMEEKTVIAPALEELRLVSPFDHKDTLLTGPMAAESAFRLAVGGSIDGVVAMLHDQATIAAKLVDWGESVNVTWGLPFVRTSVDHGVAYDAAASGEVSEDGMISAIRLADRLAMTIDVDVE